MLLSRKFHLRLKQKCLAQICRTLFRRQIWEFRWTWEASPWTAVTLSTTRSVSQPWLSASVTPRPLLSFSPQAKWLSRVPRARITPGMPPSNMLRWSKRWPGRTLNSRISRFRISSGPAMWSSRYRWNHWATRILNSAPMSQSSSPAWFIVWSTRRSSYWYSPPGRLSSLELKPGRISRVPSRKSTWCWRNSVRDPPDPLSQCRTKLPLTWGQLVSEDEPNKVEFVLIYILCLIKCLFLQINFIKGY